MSDTVDNVLNTVEESEPAEDFVVNEEVLDEEEAVVSEEEELPAASGGEETHEAGPVSVEEVVQNVQEILTTPVNEDLSDKERIVQLETRVDELINLLRSVYKQSEVDDVKIWRSDLIIIREKLNNV
jgi:hypothetical protein